MDQEDLEWKIDGYEHLTNLEYNKKRGVILYTKTILKAARSTIRSQDIFQESVWCEIKLQHQDSILVGVVYRSPNSSINNNGHLRQLMKNAVDKGNSHVLIIGGFNYPEINWLAETSPPDIHHPATVFMECLRDTYLIQHVTDPTHYRGDQRPNTLDLILTNEEGMISNIKSQTVPLGKSHHKFKFKFKYYFINRIT